MNFNKHRQQLREDHQRQIATQAMEILTKSLETYTTPILETAFHRELDDDAYWTSLLDYTDEHISQ